MPAVRRIGICAATVVLLWLATAGNAHALPRDARISFAGLGAVKLGMTERQVETAAGRELAPAGRRSCATAQFAYRTFGLFSGNRLARIYVNSRRFATRRTGLRRDARTQRVLDAYGTRVRREPHAYSDGEYLEVAHGNRKLVFETSPNGKVISISTGRRPEIDYIEGCA